MGDCGPKATLGRATYLNDDASKQTMRDDNYMCKEKKSRTVGQMQTFQKKKKKKERKKKNNIQYNVTYITLLQQSTADNGRDVLFASLSKVYTYICICTYIYIYTYIMYYSNYEIRRAE